MAESEKTYRAPGLCAPQLSDLRALNQEMRFRCSEKELQQMMESMEKLTTSFQRVSEMKDPSIPLVKYPRTPGYKPDPEDNSHNAWAWRCDVQGAATGRLAGRTVAIKDSVPVAGVPMRNGSKLLEGYVPEFDATVVTWILDAGGRITGKSAVEDMCCSGSSTTSSDGPVTNPHDTTRSAGGSSSGSAVLVQTGQVDMAIGGDQGGSIRIPASFTGIVGLKPTFGLVPYTGAAVLEPTVDHLGPMAKTVTDCALLLEVLAGYDDGRDARQFPSITVPEYSQLVDQAVAGKKVGLLKEGFEVCSDQNVTSVVKKAAQRLTEAGCTVKEICVPMHKDAVHIYMASTMYGVSKAMFESNACFQKGFYPTSLQEANFRGLRTHAHDTPPLLKMFCLYMQYIDRLYGNRFYGKGHNLVQELSRRYDAALQDVDVLVMPTLPYVAPRFPPARCSVNELSEHCFSMTSNTMAFNSTGHPALTINAGFSHPDYDSKGGLPIGMMIVGRKFDEVTILQVARAFEKLTIG